MTQPQLSLRQLSKRFKTGDGVSNITLDVQPGEMVTLLGPSGCGKTTVLRSIGGFLEPDSGDILIRGQSVLKLPPEKRPTAMVFQSYNLWPHMTVYDNLAFGLHIRKHKKASIQRAVTEALELVQLAPAARKYPAELSGGQQQRVALARALLLEPDVLLLDEPFSALDAKLRMEMREELREIQMRTGMTMVFVTHDQEEALSISDRIVVMHAGQIEQLSTPQDIYDRPQSLFVASFIGRINLLPAISDGTHIHLQTLQLEVSPGQTLLPGACTIAVRPEDVYVTDTGSGLVGKIRQVMVLGHYAEISIVCMEQTIKMFVPREHAVHLHSGDAIEIGLRKFTTFAHSTAGITVGQQAAASAVAPV
ncbi:ABC transporter ATP-binding protein [Paenibacillus campi]|uniref:ABC transporter ATP-binding protein n=1 Tax=Paenibacillus campi TaxID=3106031 RepID=UPI002B002101|nr:ABC transporter ATP-binding protein [Paenibacillus sp. SGZ-1009]